ncbi:MAG: aspartate kinase [Chloroflexota bacterium]
MALIVQKYGGTSVGSAERIKAVARRIAATVDQGHRVVAVVSAMGDTTDELIALARQITDEPSERELDLLLSTGEIVSCTLMAMALRQLGRDAIALTGFQAGIRTNATFSKALITHVEPERILRELERGRIVIVAGFQGITEDLDITTLGRGGSDTTAVAVAIGIKADRCEIYTDVDGVFTADPRVVPEARKLRSISPEEMLELAKLGARVMHPRAVELAGVYHMPLVVRSSFNDNPGTVIQDEDAIAMENRKKVRGIAHDTDVARITIVGVPDRPGIAAAIFQPLGEAAINVDVIVQNVSHHGVTDLSFTVSRNDLRKALRTIEPIARELGATEVTHDADLAKVSIVGAGIQTAPGYAGRMFKTLAEQNINIVSITTSEIRITCLIKEEEVERAVRALHAAFALEDENAPDLAPRTVSGS